MIGWKAVPVRIDVSTLTDFMIEQAKFSTQRTTANQIQSRILRKAKELELPIRKSDIKVRKTAGRVIMECKFMVPLDFPFYTYEWTFDLMVDRPIFII